MVFSLIKCFTNKILKSIIILRFGFEGAYDIHTQTTQIQKICYNNPTNYEETYDKQCIFSCHLLVGFYFDFLSLLDKLDHVRISKFIHDWAWNVCLIASCLVPTHNYVRPHMSLQNKTPAEACGITIKGNDKWRTLIENASLG